MKKTRLIAYSLSAVLIGIGLGIETTPSVTFFFLGVAVLPFAFVKRVG